MSRLSLMAPQRASSSVTSQNQRVPLGGSPISTVLQTKSGAAWWPSQITVCSFWPRTHFYTYQYGPALFLFDEEVHAFDAQVLRVEFVANNHVFGWESSNGVLFTAFIYDLETHAVAYAPSIPSHAVYVPWLQRAFGAAPSTLETWDVSNPGAGVEYEPINMPNDGPGAPEVWAGTSVAGFYDPGGSNLWQFDIGSLGKRHSRNLQ